MTRPTIELPDRMRNLDTNKAGYVVPWFVDRTVDHPDGEPDFRVADSRKLRDAIRFDLCWVCGNRRGRHASFVAGPMCAVNRTSAEPPCHLDCATYSARACPWLSTPKMIRRERGMPETLADPAGVMLRRNPGVALVWTTRAFSTYQVTNGVLFDMGEPESLAWYAQGRDATPDEVFASLDSGLPALAKMADEEGRGAPQELAARVAQVKGWVTA